MKKWMMFTPLLMIFALSIAFPERGLPAESPKIEKAALKRDFVHERFWYLFDFDFVNALGQPIEIISVNVFDVNGRKVEQDWTISGRNWDVRLMTHALSGNHPLAKIISKPRGTPLEQATVSPVGDRIKITVTNRILSAGQGIRPSMYYLSSKNKYDSLILRVAYRVNGNLQEVSHTFTAGMRDQPMPALTTHCPGAAFQFPLIGGWVGWLYADKRSTDQSGDHTGIDIFPQVKDDTADVYPLAAGLLKEVNRGWHSFEVYYPDQGVTSYMAHVDLKPGLHDDSPVSPDKSLGNLLLQKGNTHLHFSLKHTGAWSHYNDQQPLTEPDHADDPSDWFNANLNDPSGASSPLYPTYPPYRHLYQDFCRR